MKLTNHDILKPSTVIHIFPLSFQEAVGENLVAEAILGYIGELSLSNYSDSRSKPI